MTDSKTEVEVECGECGFLRTVPPGSRTEAMMRLAVAAVAWDKSNSWLTGEWDAFYAALVVVREMSETDR